MNVVYCINGHFVAVFNQAARSWHEVQRIAREEERDDAPHLANFCASCGAKNLSACEHCKTLMRPLNRLGGRPSYCVECAKPFPWTEIALATAKEYTDELEGLSSEDKNTLKQSFDDLTTDTARTPLAASRFKRIFSKVAPAAGEALMKIFVSVVTDAAKKEIGLK
jgi:hypothetical protein